MAEAAAQVEVAGAAVEAREDGGVAGVLGERENEEAQLADAGVGG